MRNFTDETSDYRFYQDRLIASGDKLETEFYKAALNDYFFIL